MTATRLKYSSAPFSNLQELQKEADQLHVDAGALQKSIGLLSERVQDGVKEKLTELNTKLTSLMDALTQRESALESQMEQAQQYNNEVRCNTLFYLVQDCSRPEQSFKLFLQAPLLCGSHHSSLLVLRSLSCFYSLLLGS